MSESNVMGSAGSALAAHSKDASAPGSTSASQVVGSAAQPTQQESDAVSGITEQAKATAERITASVSDAAGRTRQSLTNQGSHMAGQVTSFVGAQPYTALVLTGVVCFMLGTFLGRRY